MRKIWNKLSDQRAYFVLTLLVGVVFSAVSVATPTLSGYMIDAFASGSASRLLFVLWYFGLGACQAALSLLDSRMGLHFRMRQKRMMRRNVFRAFLTRSEADKESISSFVSYVNNDIPDLVEQYFVGFIDIVKCICLLLFSAASLLSVHWGLALIVGTFSAAIVFCPNAMKKQAADARQAYSGSLGQYNASLQSFLNGLRVVNAYGYRRRACEMHEQAVEAAAADEKKLIRVQLNVQMLSGFLQSGKTFLILAVGLLLIDAGQIANGLGGLLTVVQVANLIAAPAEVLAYAIHALNESRPLLDEYDALCKASPKVGKALTDPVRKLEVCGLTYAVGDLTIIDGIDVSFEAGKKYLIMGESGSGKSTLMRLLSRTGDLTYSGRILCNQKEAGEWESGSYFRKICPVFQEPYLFHATLEENILLGREISEDTYQAVLEKLNLGYLLKRYQDEEMSPQVLEQLSGGERQRVALARAMVGKPEVYLLDEVTSALDFQNAEQIERVLLEESAMVIHICHKANPERIGRYQKVLTMQAGKLLENR